MMVLMKFVRALTWEESEPISTTSVRALSLSRERAQNLGTTFSLSRGCDEGKIHCGTHVLHEHAMAVRRNDHFPGRRSEVSVLNLVVQYTMLHAFQAFQLLNLFLLLFHFHVGLDHEKKW